MVQCQGCGHESSKDTYCEMCGAALPQAADAHDDALSLMLGLVCESCDSYNDPGTATCVMCNAPLADGSAPPVTPPVVAAPAPAASAPTAEAPSWMAAPEGQPLATAQAMPAVDLSVLNQAGHAGLAAPASTTSPAPKAGVSGSAQVASTVAASRAPAAAAAVHRCANCAGDLLPDDKFCRHCGQRAAPGAAPVAAKAPATSGPSAAATMLMAAVPELPVAAPNPAVASTMFMQQVAAPGSHGAAGAGSAPSATMFFGAATVERFARLILVKGHTQFGSQWRLQAGQTVIGRNAGVVIFPDDKHLADKHCRLEFRGDELWVVPEKTTNGVYLQVKGKVPLAPGGEVICGSQRFRALPDEEREHVLGGGNGDTQLYGSQLTALNLVVMRVCADPRFSEVYARPQRILSVGRVGCDLNFPDDPFLSTRHAQLCRTDDETLVIEDLGSRNGTFIRLGGERKLAHGDAIMIGEQVMRVEVSLSLAR